MRYQLDFQGKTVVVTGAAEGIGRSISIGFASLGATVIIVDLDINKQKMLETAHALTVAGGKAVTISCDITDDAKVDELIESIKEQCGKVDILVNNAGIYRTGPSIDFSYENWDKTAAVNVRSHFFMATKIAKKFMIPAQQGKIIFMSSTAAHFGVANAVAYGVSKASTLQMARALSTEWAPFNIQVNAVNPFFVVTNLISSISQEKQDLSAMKIPMKRLACPEDIVGGVLFLCSDMASYITGVHLNIDGGRTTAG